MTDAAILSFIFFGLGFFCGWIYDKTDLTRTDETEAREAWTGESYVEVLRRLQLHKQTYKNMSADEKDGIMGKHLREKIFALNNQLMTLDKGVVMYSAEEKCEPVKAVKNNLICDHEGCENKATRFSRDGRRCRDHYPEKITPTI